MTMTFLQKPTKVCEDLLGESPHQKDNERRKSLIVAILMSDNWIYTIAVTIEIIKR